MSGHVVYRIWSGDTLLYVGLTMDLSQRLKAHSIGKPWWVEVTHITLTHYESKADAARAEELAIDSESPKYNRSRTYTNVPGGRRSNHVARELTS